MTKLYNYPDIMTIDETREVLRIGRGLCYQYLNEGIIKGFKVGSKTWKIPRESVEEFINTHSYRK